jgi:RNA polymerase sigma-70 factor, ECF subfamily
MTNPDREKWWVLRAQAGDREAFDELLKVLQEQLYRYIFSLVGQQSLAEDILQEVFIRIYRKLGWLREPELFRPWAFRIASNESFRHLKREARWSEQVRDEDTLKAIPSPPLPQREGGGELLERLPRMLGDISPASRAVIVLYYLHEMSSKRWRKSLPSQWEQSNRGLPTDSRVCASNFAKQRLFDGR